MKNNPFKTHLWTYSPCDQVGSFWLTCTFETQIFDITLAFWKHVDFFDTYLKLIPCDLT